MVLPANAQRPAFPSGVGVHSASLPVRRPCRDRGRSPDDRQFGSRPAAVASGPRGNRGGPRRGRCRGGGQSRRCRVIRNYRRRCGRRGTRCAGGRLPTGRWARMCPPRVTAVLRRLQLRVRPQLIRRHPQPSLERRVRKRRRVPTLHIRGLRAPIDPPARGAASPGRTPPAGRARFPRTRQSIAPAADRCLL
jgi:hypothetical protein